MTELINKNLTITDDTFNLIDGESFELIPTNEQLEQIFKLACTSCYASLKSYKEINANKPMHDRDYVFLYSLPCGTKIFEW